MNNLLYKIHSLANNVAVDYDAFTIEKGLGWGTDNSITWVNSSNTYLSLILYQYSSISINRTPISGNKKYIISYTISDATHNIFNSFIFYDALDNAISQIDFNDSTVSGVNKKFNFTAPENAIKMKWVFTNNYSYDIILSALQLEEGTGNPTSWSSGSLLSLSTPNVDVIEKTNNLYHKAFASGIQRYDNTFNTATLFSRIISQSNKLSNNLVDLNTSLATPLSDGVIVDILPPTISVPLEVISTSIGHKKKLKITTTDISKIKAFRIAYESSNGFYSLSNWLNFAYYSENNTLEYEIDFSNYFDPKNNPYISGLRNVYVQLLDYAGNIKNSNIVPVLIDAIAETFYKNPINNLCITDSHGTQLETINKPSIYLHDTSLNNKIKDVRYRDIISNNYPNAQNNWSDWVKYDEFIPLILNNNTDGLHRLEIQVRDFGNNIVSQGLFEDIILSTVEKDTIFTCGFILNDIAYICGIKSETFNAMQFKIVSSLSTSNSKTFNLLTPSNVEILIHKNDRFSESITISDVVYKYKTDGDTITDPYFEIDTINGRITFVDPTNNDLIPNDEPSETIDFKREIAVIYIWNKISSYKIADLSFYDEKAIISITGYDDTLFLGGLSGNIYTFKENILSLSKIFKINNIAYPVSLLRLHQFIHEDSPYIYAGTANKPRLIRGEFSKVKDGFGWEDITNNGYLAQTSGSITCAYSGYNMLILGTSTGKIITITPNINSILNIEEYLLQNNEHINDISVSGNQILVGFRNKPEIWAATLKYQEFPENKEVLNILPFADYNVTENSQWQYYNNGSTIVLNNSQLDYLLIKDPNSYMDYRYVKKITGISQKVNALSTDSNTEWNKNLDDIKSWIVEVEMMQLDRSSNGKQGFRIADGRYSIDIALSSDYLYLRSGNNTFKTLLNKTAPVSIFSSSSDTWVSGIRKLWNFNNLTKENYGAIWNSSTTDTLGTKTPDENLWLADRFIQTSNAYAGTVETIEIPPRTNQSVASNYKILKVQPTTSGNPRMIWIKPEGESAIRIDSQTKISMRVRFGLPNTNYALDDLNTQSSKIRIAVSPYKNTSWDNITWNESNIVSSKDFIIYEFYPSYCGSVESVAIEFVDLPEKNPRIPIYIDYIAISNDVNTFGQIDLSDNLVPIRVAVDYNNNYTTHNLKVWIGKTEYPIANLDNFLSLLVNDKKISFGKIHTYTSDITNDATTVYENASVWGYGQIKFATFKESDNVQLVSPIIRESLNFSKHSELPNTTGICKLINYRNTVWAICSGIDSVVLFDDNNDQNVQYYAFNPNTDEWVKQSIQSNNPFSYVTVALPYRSDLILSGNNSFSGNLRMTTINSTGVFNISNDGTKGKIVGMYVKTLSGGEVTCSIYEKVYFSANTLTAEEWGFDTYLEGSELTLYNVGKIAQMTSDYDNILRIHYQVDESLNVTLEPVVGQEGLYESIYAGPYSRWTWGDPTGEPYDSQKAADNSILVNANFVVNDDNTVNLYNDLALEQGKLYRFDDLFYTNGCNIGIYKSDPNDTINVQLVVYYERL